mmetsp:Transcript_8190/g.16721  ORF Transcript_8190/g.16721 Transcript_8190/m.16721 type:complete len:89 (+) Transcript_8190:160-426(+)
MSPMPLFELPEELKAATEATKIAMVQTNARIATAHFCHKDAGRGAFLSAQRQHLLQLLQPATKQHRNHNMHEPMPATNGTEYMAKPLM